MNAREEVLARIRTALGTDPPVVPEPPKRVHAVHVGEPQVEDDGVVVVLAPERNAFRAGAGHVDGVALLGQAAP